MPVLIVLVGLCIDLITGALAGAIIANRANSILKGAIFGLFVGAFVGVSFSVFFAYVIGDPCDNLLCIEFIDGLFWGVPAAFSGTGGGWISGSLLFDRRSGDRAEAKRSWGNQCNARGQSDRLGA